MRSKRLPVLLIGLIIASGYYLVAVRHHARLARLADHGKHAVGQITGFSEANHAQYTQYSYDVDGVSFGGSGGSDNLPGAIGAPVHIQYLPEDPSFHQAGTPVTN